MAEACVVFKKISGTFYRSVLTERLQQVLDPPGPNSAGRYHRPGEPTLYTSATLEWSIRAIAGYMREDGLPRVVVPLKVGDAMVLDQQDEEACKQLVINRDLSNESWRTALSEGREPASWRTVDIARTAGADGIIDRSRMIPGGWHLNLFRWNESGGPLVEVCGDPVEIVLTPHGPKWGL
ncbi:RES family NAD+ phosphorylase [Rhizobium sp. VS19-DR104.2]|nr:MULTISPECIES: RES family NAD+ phosphorylase [unclassified Rhizobium]MBZ5762475.1 RES family NAD+ phosphorylase [Rhizobium sp. VS19-DR96]MBZ5787200.1 RES family NAD+ phosphorylase [Rhizobium sp. VS19-DR121]MBZ5804553.1 RES family NAD+ phosphorylase [Rhizobium sp. VS19-DR181]MBZ5832765.1 RES family NAD+ phosphorylase [Rhizobium sp. VS19-DR104.2]MBZ5844056.1 RES family NAD+ phosphorylase [Rhizobium sp. VS19-DR104.1]